MPFSHRRFVKDGRCITWYPDLALCTSGNQRKERQPKESKKYVRRKTRIDGRARTANSVRRVGKMDV
jgi:hypothetical protein